MPDQQYEPTTDDILRCYMQRGGYEEEFNRWYEADMTAAEQRGAIKALRDAANEVHVEARWQLERKMHGQSHTIDSVDRLLEIEKLLKYRADRMEGDDE